MSSRMNGAPQEVAPSNGEAERGLLAALFARPEQLDDPRVAGVRPGDFFHPPYRTIYRHLSDGWNTERLTAESLPARLVAAGDFTDDVRAEVIKLAANPSTGLDAPAFAGLIQDEAEQRRMWLFHAELGDQIKAKLPPEDVRGFVASFLDQHTGGAAIGGPRDMADVIEQNKELRPVVIDGLARVGEVVNIVAPSKRGKSWLVLMLVLCVVIGKRLFGAFACTPGKVLLLDNELHAQTSAYRVRAVAKGMGIDITELRGKFQIDNVRGQDLDINGLVKYFARFKPGDLSVIVLDALYRFYPKGFDENANADMTWLYNVLDGIANRLQCVIVCIVHSSKGNQADKALVDVGSGAGALARAPDTHIAIREHEEPGCVVFDKTARSFPPSDPICLRWDWPLWVLDDNLDPDRLFRPGRKAKDKPTETIWTAEMFAKRFGTPEPQMMPALVDAAVGAGLGERKAADLVRRAAATGKLFKWPTDDRREFAYATVAPPTAKPKARRKAQK